MFLMLERYARFMTCNYSQELYSAADGAINGDNAVVVLGHHTTDNDDSLFFWDYAQAIAAEHGVLMHELVLGTFSILNEKVLSTD